MIMNISLLLAVTQLVPGGGMTSTLPIVQVIPLISISGWYERGVVTANGEKFNPNACTAAHRTLEFGTQVLFINPVVWWNPLTWKYRVARINDRGPYKRGRQFDLARGTATEIGVKEKGITKLITIVLSKPSKPKIQTAKAKGHKSASRHLSKHKAKTAKAKGHKSASHNS